MGEHDEHIVFEMGYNKGLKDGIKGSIPKADYENRLNAGVVAMLTEIREKAWYHHSKFDDDRDFEVDKVVEDIVNYIDAKINSLKENEHDAIKM